ncbi:5575_t:CDS:2, partial [Acaulospora morrowiae]
MPHATESLNLTNAPSASSPIPIPGSTSSYIRTSIPSYDQTTTASANNMSDYVAPDDGASYDQFICANFSTEDTSAVPIQSEGRNVTYYCYDYGCCDEEINNLHDFLQHVDTRHPGLYVNSTYGIMSLDANAIYSQSRLPAIPVYSMIPAKLNVEDESYDKDLFLARHLSYSLRDPNVTATTFLSGQISGPSSISASFEDDDLSALDTLNNSPFHTDHDPSLSVMPSPPLSLSSCPTTPVFLQSTVSSPLGLESVGIPAAYIPILSPENSTASTLGQVASSSHVDHGTNANDQRRMSTPVTSMDPSDSSNVPLNRQPSYGSYISTSSVSASAVENNNQNRRAPLKSIKKQPTTYGSLTIPNSSPSATEHDGRRDSSSSSPPRTVDPNSLINRQKSPYFNSTAAENPTAFIPATTSNYLQAGPIKMEKQTSPTSILPSNTTSGAFIATPKISSDQSRSQHVLSTVSLRPYTKTTSSIDNATLAPTFIPPVSNTSYSMNSVD